MLYHTEIKTFEHISELEIANLTQYVFDIVANPPDGVKSFNERYVKSRADGGKMIGENAENHYNFFVIPINFIDLSNFAFVFDVFANIELPLVNFFVFTGGNNLQPHTDRAVRKFAANFGLHNYEQSKTSFYSSLNRAVMPNDSFAFNEIKLESELTYRPKTLHAINVQEIHGVTNSNNDPRIIMSANINNNSFYQQFTDRLKP